MSPDGLIQAEHLWKRFRSGRRRMLLRDELQRLGDRIRGRAPAGWRWALSDVTFTAEPGDSIGLVGTNGSGKTTLLKILTRVMYPYAGRLEVNGRVGALIEVRAGIHPDLTGRENTFVTGSLLGLSRKEVARRFDEIVAFAELEGAIDRQVKFFSSGMQMRLGFAVAAFLEPDILLVDEALAVGDGAFQQKCLDRMRAVLADGTTLVYVSHDLGSVEATCRRGLWLDEGVIRADAPVHDVLSQYRQSIEEAAEVHPTSDLVRVVKAQFVGPSGPAARTDGPLEVQLTLEGSGPTRGTLSLGVSEGPATPIFVSQHEIPLDEGHTEVRWTIPRLPLPRGRFFLWAGITDDLGGIQLSWQPAGSFDVSGPDLEAAPRGVVRLAPVHVESRWEVDRS